MTPPPPPSGFRIPMLGLIAIVVLAMAGGAMLMFAFMSVDSIASAPTPTLTAPPTVVAIVIPSVTPAPTQAPATETPVPSPTDTPGPTSAPTEDTSQLFINLPANVRSGPGTNYPVIGGLAAGTSAPIIGRDSTGVWYVIAYAESVQGWVSNLVAEYRGDTAALPVIAAPPPPPTAVPPTATLVPTAVKTPTPAGRGIVGTLTLCNPSKTTYAVNERVCFVEKIVNTTNATINYGLFGVLAVSTSGGANQFQTSWFGNLAIDAGCTGPTDRCGGVWEDGSHITVPGTYSLQLRICYSALSQCQSGGDWETLTSGIAITIQ